MGKVSTFPIKIKDNETIEYVQITVQPSFYEGNYELTMSIRSDKEHYRTVRIEKKEFLKSEFDMIFDRVKEDLKRFIEQLK